MLYLNEEIRSAIIAGTVIKEVTLYCCMVSRADLASNLGIKTWQAPIISMAMADDKLPM